MVTGYLYNYSYEYCYWLCSSRRYARGAELPDMCPSCHLRMINSQVRLINAWYESLFPSTMTTRHTNQAGLWLGLGLAFGLELECRVGVVVAFSRSCCCRARVDLPAQANYVPARHLLVEYFRAQRPTAYQPSRPLLRVRVWVRVEFRVRVVAAVTNGNLTSGNKSLRLQQSRGETLITSRIETKKFMRAQNKHGACVAARSTDFSCCVVPSSIVYRYV